MASGFAAYVLPAGKTMYLLLSTDGTNVAVSQGTYAGQSLRKSTTPGQDVSLVLTGTGAIPQEPDGYTAFGLIKVVTANAATFTPGTTLLDATDVTATFFDLNRVPSVAP